MFSLLGPHFVSEGGFSDGMMPRSGNDAGGKKRRESIYLRLFSILLLLMILAIAAAEPFLRYASGYAEVYRPKNWTTIRAYCFYDVILCFPAIFMGIIVCVIQIVTGRRRIFSIIILLLLLIVSFYYALPGQDWYSNGRFKGLEALGREVDFNHLARDCLYLHEKKIEGYPPDIWDSLPETVKRVNPKYIYVNDDDTWPTKLEMLGGFDHMGFDLFKENDEYVLQWYQEFKKGKVVARLPVKEK